MAPEQKKSTARLVHKTKLGEIHLGDAVEVLRNQVKPGSIDLIMTSPPFGLVRKKDYGNVDADKYVEWFKPFGKLFHEVLKPSGHGISEKFSTNNLVAILPNVMVLDNTMMNWFSLMFSRQRGTAMRGAA
ncbi:MAG: DNA methyltransferase [Planctomycetota bacterium]